MRLGKNGRLERTDIWREGKYLDLWSVPHFLSGMGVAFALYFLGFDAYAAFIIGFLLLVAYEIFEVVAKIEEERLNSVLDVVVGMVSFTPTFLLAPEFPMQYTWAVFIIVVILDSVLSFFGWRASQKASVLEAALRVEYEREKEKFIEKKEKLQMRWRRGKKRRAEALARIMGGAKKVE